MSLFSFSRLHSTTICASIGLALAGCAGRQAAGPTVMALPAKGESFALFQQHDATCRQYASDQTGGKTPGQAAANSGVAHALLGTGIGAAAGALIGSASGHAGNGAAIGAGTGLLAGSLVGAASGRNAAASVQHRYNVAYTQCMVANGEQIAPGRAACGGLRASAQNRLCPRADLFHSAGHSRRKTVGPMMLAGDTGQLANRR